MVEEFHEEEDIRHIDRSSRFLDHNSIEYVWDGLGKAISQRSSPPSTHLPQELKVLLLEKRALLPQIGTLINSMAARCEVCTAVHSGQTFPEKIPEGSDLANMVANDPKMVAKVAKLATNLVAKNDVNLALPPRFRQVLIESPL
ncbi:hypothetical protein TNCV_983971 [Trichonephila clavipes]|nr:hypothetical protein TNCV_983971 [Trichonephila clavipes]